jgi:uracil-DNA glycosylase
MTRLSEFQQLAREAAACTLCERMCDRRAVLSRRNGSIRARAMFIAEAPGRNGADRTRIPFSGDLSGVYFEALIASIGLSRREIFITNSVLCSPRRPNGANDKPTPAEVRNCTGFLRRQIEIVDPEVIVTLGSVALGSLSLIDRHSYKLKETVATVLSWSDRLLIPLYHPSPRVINAARPLAAQMEDYRAVRRALDSKKICMSHKSINVY